MSLATIGMQAHYPIGCRWQPIPKSAPVEAPNPFRVCRMSFAATHSAGCKSSAMVETKTCPCQSQGQTSATCYNIKIHKTCYTMLYLHLESAYCEPIWDSLEVFHLHSGGGKKNTWLRDTFHHCKSGSRDIVLPPSIPEAGRSSGGFPASKKSWTDCFQIQWQCKFRVFKNYCSCQILPIYIKNDSKCFKSSTTKETKQHQD